LKLCIYLETSTEQQDSKEHTSLAVRITWSRVSSDDDLRFGLRTDETRNLRKEKKVLKKPSPPPKKLVKELKKKQNPKKKKKKDADVKLDKDGLPIYDQSLFSSFEAPEWLDAEQECHVGSAYCTNYGGRVRPFDPQWRCELPDATRSLELRSVIFQHRDEVEYRRYMYCATKSFSQFLSHFLASSTFL
jgi:hypothetical protein